MRELAELANQAFGIELNEEQLLRFTVYERVLLEWNDKVNLTAIRDKRGILIKHFLDSLSCVLAIQEPPESLIDIGSGAGFPGLVLKIFYPSARVVLADSIGKKARFCELAAREMGFNDVLSLPARAEELGNDPAHRGRYQWVTARAVARLPILLEYLLPLAKVGGMVLAQKGATAQEELDDSSNALSKLGGMLDRVVPIHLPELEDERSLIVIKKVSPTPRIYPRLAGIPAKKPL
ncbi:MAG TPA: 16S rRNA (guanine(527)-N(7))-methyltransferase RsmG [Anaerolineales bacterium]|nr:16S rRNA (guanine(527)-N(7))-methyltransferase RsmG [Anaerolineales bacterium]